MASNLIDLPSDLHGEIASHLEIRDVGRLLCTSRYFQENDLLLKTQEELRDQKALFARKRAAKLGAIQERRELQRKAVYAEELYLERLNMDILDVRVRPLILQEKFPWLPKKGLPSFPGRGELVTTRTILADCFNVYCLVNGLWDGNDSGDFMINRELADWEEGSTKTLDALWSDVLRNTISWLSFVEIKINLEYRLVYIQCYYSNIWRKLYGLYKSTSKQEYQNYCDFIKLGDLMNLE